MKNQNDKVKLATLNKLQSDSMLACFFAGFAVVENEKASRLAA